MAAREIAVIIKARDKTAPVFQGISGRLGKLGGVAKTALGVGLGIVGVKAIGAVVGSMKSAIDVAGDFESQMNILGVAARSAGTGLGDLRKASIAVGADAKLVGISASEAADAITNFYKAGLSTADIFQDLNGYLEGTAELGGALRSSIDLAAASELDLAAASDVVSVAMATFGLKAADATRIADSFVGAADASVAEVYDLTEAMKNVGPTAAQFGWSLEDVNTALALLSTRGIRGAEAGTALRSMMTNLMRPTNDVVGSLRELGVELYDSSGQLKALPDIIGDLSKAFTGTITTTKTLGGATKAQKKELAGYAKQIAGAKKALEEYQAGIRGTSMKEKTRAKRVAELTKKIAFYEAKVKGVNIAEKKLVKSVKKLTEEQKNQYIQTLAGTYGMKAMATLLAEGTEGWEDMAEAIEKAATAQEVAEARTRGYQGALEQFRGVIETIKIVIGTPILERFLTPAIKALSEFFGIAADKGPQIEKVFDNVAGAVGKLSEGVKGLWAKAKPYFDAITAGLTTWWNYLRTGGALADIRQGWATYIGGPTDYLWKQIKPWWDYIDKQLSDWYDYFRRGGALGEIRDGWAQYIGGPTDWLWKQIKPWFDYIDKGLSDWWNYLRTGGALAEIRKGWAENIGGPTQWLWDSHLKPWFDYIDTELSAWWKYLHTGGALKEIREGWKLHIADPLIGFWEKSGLKGNFAILTLHISSWAQTAYGWISTHLIENLKRLPAEVRTIWAEMRRVAEGEAGKELPSEPAMAGVFGWLNRTGAAAEKMLEGWRKGTVEVEGASEANQGVLVSLWKLLKEVGKFAWNLVDAFKELMKFRFEQLIGALGVIYDWLVDQNKAMDTQQGLAEALALGAIRNEQVYSQWLDAATRRMETLNQRSRDQLNLIRDMRRALRGLDPVPSVGGLGDTRGEGYQFGGVVPGPIGQPRLATVHGGEVITPSRRARRGGPGVHIDFRGAHFYGIDETMIEELFEEERIMRALRGIKRSEY